MVLSVHLLKTMEKMKQCENKWELVVIKGIKHARIIRYFC